MNNNDPFNELPKRLDGNESPNMNLPKEEKVEEQKPIIEIPQEYYDKLEKERLEKEKAEQEKLEKQNEIREIKKESNKMLSLVCLNTVIVLGCLALTVKVNEFCLLILPVAIVALSIFEGLKDKELSNYPGSILVGSMGCAVVSYFLSMAIEAQVDMFTYFAIASAITAFLGLLIANIITKIISKQQEIKALETIGYVIFFVALIGAPFFVYKKYPEQFYKYVFQKQGEVHAETEEEFITKTLKNRYGKTFACETKFKTHVYTGSKTYKERTCRDSDNKEVKVNSIVYNQIENKYIIIDNYTDTLFLDSVRNSVSTKVSSQINNVRTVITYLYPKNNCKFVGDCVECDEYFEHYEDEINFDNLYKSSSNLNFEKSMSLSPINFINNNEFKIVLNIVINADVSLGDQYYDGIIQKVLESLNELELKNTFGYQITINRMIPSEGVTIKDYVVKGPASSEGFVNPTVVK